MLTGMMSFLNPMANPLSNGGNQPQWDYLERLLQSAGNVEASGAAALFSPTARQEAASKLISNHLHVLRDVCNSAPGTQTHLRRVPVTSAQFVDEALRETARRLLGNVAGSEAVRIASDPSNPAQQAAWAATAAYLDGRIQTHEDECPPGRRKPDMSLEAGKAMRAVLAEVGNTKSANMDGINPLTNGFNKHQWMALEVLMQSNKSGGAHADGAAAGFSQAAREEAAGNLIRNHEYVLKDVCNPSRTKNIVGNPLTQTHLKRVDPALAQFVDQLLRECARRLLGRRPGTEALRIPAEPQNGALEMPLQHRAWMEAATYLDGRIHSRREEKPERTPDMGEEAGAAMKAVLTEIAAKQ